MIGLISKSMSAVRVWAELEKSTKRFDWSLP